MSTTQMIPEMLTIQEVAGRTHLGYDTIRRFCLEGKIVYIKSGSKFLLNWNSVLDFFNTGEGRTHGKEV
jgi:excisionase family DNA binding protein